MDVLVLGGTSFVGRAIVDDLLARATSRRCSTGDGLVWSSSRASSGWSENVTPGTVRRAAAGGRVAVPARLDRPVQVVDVRDPAWDVMLRTSHAAADAVGMPHTPLAQTVADIRAWDLDRGEPSLTTGISADQERDLVGQALPG